MKLSKICEEIEYTLLQGSLETEVRDIMIPERLHRKRCLSAW